MGAPGNGSTTRWVPLVPPFIRGSRTPSSASQTSSIQGPAALITTRAGASYSVPVNSSRITSEVTRLPERPSRTARA